jgi:acyl carrier protein
MASVFGQKTGKIPDDIKQSNYPKWDSLKHISLAVQLEETFDVFFEPEEISELTSIENIIDIIEKKQNR